MPSSPRGAAAPQNYWEESRRPLAALAFIAPWLLLYELGIVVFGVQNGADVWMRQFLGLLDFGQHFLLPALTVGILLAWHHLAHQPWRLSRGVLPLMHVESLLGGFVLWIFSQMCMRALQSAGTAQIVGPAVLAGLWRQIGGAIGFLGAGIYEELLFRLILLSGLLVAARRMGMRPTAASCTAIITSSLIFSAAHYVGREGDTFLFSTFIFRALAGAFFAVLFVYRGFGIAAGAHAAYDILADFLARALS